MKNIINDRILKAIRLNNLVPIVGAGVSYYYGYLNWKGLLIKLSEKYNVKLNANMIEGKDYLQIAEALLQKSINERDLSYEQKKLFIKEFNKNVIKCFQEGYDKNNKRLKEINKIEKLKDISFQTIITTNYDNILENEIFNDKKYCVIYPSVGKELHYDEYKPCIMKIHGDLSEANSIILTQSQYFDFINSKGYFNSKLYTLFTTNIIIMIGYSFRDININEIYFKYRNEFKEYINDIMPKAYMVVTSHDISEMGEEYYELYKLYLMGNGIEVIDAYETLGDFINELVNKVNEDNRIRDAYEHIKFDSNTNITCDILDNIVAGKKISLGQIDTERINYTIAKEICTFVSMMLVNPLELDEFSGRWSGNLGIDGKLPYETCEELFELIKICFGKHNDIANMAQFDEIVAYSLEYADQFRFVRDDFYIYPNKFGIFMELVKGVRNFNLKEDMKNLFSKVFSSALNYSGLERGKCNGSAKLLEEGYTMIPSKVFEVYFAKSKENALKEVMEYQDDGADDNVSWKDYKRFHKQELYWLENRFAKNENYSQNLKDKIISFVNEINTNQLL